MKTERAFNVFSIIRVFSISVILIFILLVGSCKKDGVGKIRHEVKYTVDKSTFRQLKGPDDTSYTKFGKFITSITPKHFSAKLNIMNFMDHWDLMDQKTHMIGFLNNTNGAEISEYANFSNNQEVTFKPTLGGQNIIYTDESRTESLFKEKTLTFNYFTFVYYYFYQELDLPAAYKDVKLDQFNQYYNEWIKPNYGGTQYNSDTMKFGTLLKSRSAPFTSNLDYVSNVIIFGNTDSTFLFNKDYQRISASENYTLGGSANWMVIRSHKFAPVKVTMPDEGQLFVYKTTVVFDTENLIQIYAGKDNISYTSDDVFIYSPRFWERMKVKFEVIQ